MTSPVWSSDAPGITPAKRLEPRAVGQQLRRGDPPLPAPDHPAVLDASRRAGPTARRRGDLELGRRSQNTSAGSATTPAATSRRPSSGQHPAHPRPGQADVGQGVLAQRRRSPAPAAAAGGTTAADRVEPGAGRRGRLRAGAAPRAAARTGPRRRPRGEPQRLDQRARFVGGGGCSEVEVVDGVAVRGPGAPGSADRHSARPGRRRAAGAAPRARRHRGRRREQPGRRERRAAPGVQVGEVPQRLVGPDRRRCRSPAGRSSPAGRPCGAPGGRRTG